MDNGHVKLTESGVRLTFTLHDHKRERDISAELVHIAWGERSYLIATNQMVEFCNAINSGEEPRTHEHGGFLFREGDEYKATQGRPFIPEAYKKYLLGKPLEAVIIGGGEFRPRPGMEKLIDVGLKLQLNVQEYFFEGMKLYFEVPGFNLCTIRVIAVKEGYAEAEAMVLAFDKNRPEIEVGMKLSSANPYIYR